MTEKRFNVTRDDQGNVAGIEFNAEAFIIPNQAGKITAFWCSSAAREVKELATSVLGEEPDEDEIYVQMWYVAKDLGCDNLVDHRARVEIDGKKYVIGMEASYLPYSLLRDRVEGDTISITFPNHTRVWEDELGYNIPITMHVTLNQNDYRYRNFGPFQDVLRKVVR
ncbi:MAG: hypothetical protein J6Y02_01360 [Pseudobutyrivibrio sp.]|nr:hypothetical protein [Pseudobutyrivibrio sp.]